MEPTLFGHTFMFCDPVRRADMPHGQPFADTSECTNTIYMTAPDGLIRLNKQDDGTYLGRFFRSWGTRGWYVPPEDYAYWQTQDPDDPELVDNDGPDDADCFCFPPDEMVKPIQYAGFLAIEPATALTAPA